MISQVIATTPIGELMNKDVVTLGPMETMMKAKEVFDANEFHHIPIVDEEGKVVGMLSRMDYNRVLSAHMLFNKDKNQAFCERNLQALQVQDVMNKNVVSVKEVDGLVKAAEIFRENHFHALPVVDDQKKLLGIITTYDLLIFAYCK